MKWKKLHLLFLIHYSSPVVIKIGSRPITTMPNYIKLI